MYVSSVIFLVEMELIGYLIVFVRKKQEIEEKLGKTLCLVKKAI
jgi:hypothetical protein